MRIYWIEMGKNEGEEANTEGMKDTYSLPEKL